MPTPQQILYGHAQHVGKRSEQQDSFGFFTSKNPDADFVAVVADGMGGMDCGREASQVAVDAFLASYATTAPGESVADALDRAVYAANDAVKKMAEERAEVGEVGTTLLAAAIRGNLLYWVSVGDSRLYLVNERSIRRLNVEHNLKAKLRQLVEQGHLEEAEVDANPQKEALTSYVGIETLRDVDISENGTPLTPADRVILCSDGLYKTLGDEDIWDCVLASPNDESPAARLLGATMEKEAPYQDNVTVLSLVLGCRASEPPTVRIPVETRRRRPTGKLLAITLFSLPCVFALLWLIKNLAK